MSFQTPIALFLFRRSETLSRIISVLRDIEAEKIYLICDEGRNRVEREQVAKTRRVVEEEIDWACEVIKHYADENRGVLRNIGDGAKWVFQHEEKAIFLEDDNLPEPSFFPFCEEMLDMYENDSRVLWICGSNYLGDVMETGYDKSYFFSQMLLPCGWASWREKFVKYYDSRLEGLNKSEIAEEFKKSYNDRRLYLQENRSMMRTLWRIQNDLPRASWDYQMILSLRANHMYGIVPSKNQIRNIGVDSISEHGGSSMKNPMTRRFCENDTMALTFPLQHPDCFATPFESQLGEIILAPLSLRIRGNIGALLKRVLKMNEGESFSRQLKERIGSNGQRP